MVRPLAMNGGPLPPRFYTRFRYSETITLDSAGSGNLCTNHLWNLNSLFDPNNSGVGSQPRGFDQLLPTIYQKYRVFAVKATFQPIIIGAGVGGTGLFGIQAVNGTTPLITTPTDARECIGVKSWVVSDTRTPPKFSKYFRCADVAGMPKSAYNGDDQTMAAYNANPITLSRINTFCASPDGSITGVTFRMTVDFTFFCVLFERKVLPQS